MSNDPKINVERPLESDKIFDGIHNEANGIDTRQYYTTLAAKASEGCLTDYGNKRAIIRVKIRPDFFIVETDEEFTAEEISTNAWRELIENQADALINNVEPVSKAKSMKEIIRIDCENTGSKLRKTAKLLPIIIKVEEWILHNGEEIRFDLKGSQGMEELVNVSHLGLKAWEIDRVSALILNDAKGVFYATQNILDVTVTKSPLTLENLRHHVIFRMLNVKLWINTPLQLAIPSPSPEVKRILYQHPSLINDEDLKSITEGTKHVSALLIPGVTNFNLSELEIISPGGKEMHYFTAQCYFSKKDLTLDKFLEQLHEKYDENYFTPYYENGNNKEEAEAMLAASGPDLEKISSSVSKQYIERYLEKGTETETDKTPLVSFKRSVLCFFGPNFNSITSCIQKDKCGLQMHLFPLLDDNKKRTFVVSHGDIMNEIHNSGRFFNLTKDVAGFLPDVDFETFRCMLYSSRPGSYTLVASLLYYNNVDIGKFLESLRTTSDRLPSLADAIVELVTTSPIDGDICFRAVDELARAISTLYRLRNDSDSILFPDQQLMIERCSGNRPYYWNDPIRCVVSLYRVAMDKRQTKYTDNFTSMHISVLELVLVPFFDTVLKTGAWAIHEVRNFLRWILESVLLKYTAIIDQQFILDSIARLCVHWAIMQSGAENRGVCTAFSEETSFIIEPGLSLTHYTLSDIPGALLTGENVVENIKSSMVSRNNTAIQQQVRVVSVSLPSSQFFEYGRGLTVLIVGPNESIQTTDKRTEKERLLIDYSAPFILTEPQVEKSDIGFAHMKKATFATYSLRYLNTECDDVKHAPLLVNGALSALSIDGKMEHVNLTLPCHEMLTNDAIRHKRHLIKDKGLEVVFYEPLLSSSVLIKAASQKRVYFDSSDLYKDYLAPLKTGEIVIRPNNNMSRESVAGLGFDWLWRVLQKDHGTLVDEARFRPKFVPLRRNRIYYSQSPVKSLLINAIKQLSKKGTCGSQKKRALADNTASDDDNSSAFSFSPSFADIDTFLKQDFKSVLSTILIRMTMIVSNSEIQLIKSVCEKVTNIILDSFYVSLAPEENMLSILERISEERNGIFLNTGTGVSRLIGTNILATEQPNTNESTISALDTLQNYLESLGSEGSKIETKQNFEQSKKIRDSTVLTSTLIELIRDDNKPKRMNDMLSEALQSQQRIPLHMISATAKPEKPMSGLSTTGKPHRSNFSSAQYVYVPVNPKNILTDVQWLECILIIKEATQDFAKAVRYYEEAAESTLKQLKELLEKWSEIVGDVTSDIMSPVSSCLSLKWLESEATRIAKLREAAEKTKVAITVQGEVVNIAKYDIIAVSRSLIDVDFYVRLPNSWPSGNWKEIIHSAVSLASIPLHENISRGIMAASQTAMAYDSSFALSSTERIINEL